MGEIYIKVLLIMLVLFLFMAPGFLLKKFNMIGKGQLTLFPQSCFTFVSLR